MGVGKTTVGRILASRLDRPFFDSDAYLGRTYSTDARHLATDRGVDWLHRAEAEALVSALAEKEPAVIAAAASLADRPDLPEIISGCPTRLVLLDGDPEVLVERAARGGHRRPITSGDYRRLMAGRRRVLEPHVDLVVDVTERTPSEIVDDIISSFRQSAP